MDNLDSINKEITEIQARNRRVEADKAWEISGFRKFLIGIITYIIAATFMVIAEIDQPLINACIPSGAYVLSTWSLPFFKRWWIKNRFGGWGSGSE